MASAEEVIRARIAATLPDPTPEEKAYKSLLGEEVPKALDRLKDREWEGGELAIVARRGHKVGEPGEELAVWKLTTLIYLTSGGSFAIKVTDPLSELSYELAEVDYDYMVKNHTTRRTINYLRDVIPKL